MTTHILSPRIQTERRHDVTLQEFLAGMFNHRVHRFRYVLMGSNRQLVFHPWLMHLLAQGLLTTSKHTVVQTGLKKNLDDLFLSNFRPTS